MSEKKKYILHTSLFLDRGLEDMRSVRKFSRHICFRANDFHLREMSLKQTKERLKAVAIKMIKSKATAWFSIVPFPITLYQNNQLICTNNKSYTGYEFRKKKPSLNPFYILFPLTFMMFVHNYVVLCNNISLLW